MRSIAAESRVYCYQVWRRFALRLAAGAWFFLMRGRRCISLTSAFLQQDYRECDRLLPPGALSNAEMDNFARLRQMIAFNLPILRRLVRLIELILSRFGHHISLLCSRTNC